ncbi:MAG TPA: GlcNAc-transferase family protein [Acidimicrobiales bacterium]
MAGPTDTIYVQVPAYRDPELGPTLLDLYAKAAHPGRLRTCVLWQRDDEELPDEVRRLPGLELIEASYRESRSANWARSILQQRWDGEPFTMLIDSTTASCPAGTPPSWPCTGSVWPGRRSRC